MKNYIVLVSKVESITGVVERITYCNEENLENIVSKIKELCSERLPKAYKADAISDIQVLSPMKHEFTGHRKFKY